MQRKVGTRLQNTMRSTVPVPAPPAPTAAEPTTGKARFLLQFHVEVGTSRKTYTWQYFGMQAFFSCLPKQYIGLSRSCDILGLATESQRTLAKHMEQQRSSAPEPQLLALLRDGHALYEIVTRLIAKCRIYLRFGPSTRTIFEKVAP